MKAKVLIFLALLTAFIGLTGCNNAGAPKPIVKSSPPPQQQQAPAAQNGHGHDEAAIASAQRISLADAKKEFDAGTAVFVDTRDPNTFRFKRIKGAMNIPVEAVDLRYKDIPQGKKIIAYCS
jgi:hypothetical protein